MSVLMVTRAGSSFGQRVLHHLLHTAGVPPYQLIAASRRPSTLRPMRGCGIGIRRADFDDPRSLTMAFEGVQRLLLIGSDRPDPSGTRLAQQLRAIVAAEREGVQHLLYTSCPFPEASALPLAAEHAAVEAAVRRSSLPGWTVLRLGPAFEPLAHTLPLWLAQGGTWLSACGEARWAALSADDLARATALRLATPAAGRSVFTLTGEQALQTTEQASLLSRLLGHPLRVQAVTVADLARHLTRELAGADLPAALVETWADRDAHAAAGHLGEPTPDFRRLTGSAPQGLADWARSKLGALARQGIA